ncbi:FecR domain-containing protein [Oceaniferula spumae]
MARNTFNDDVFLERLIRLEAGECSAEEVAALNNEMLASEDKRKALIGYFEQSQRIVNVARQNRLVKNALPLSEITVKSRQGRWSKISAIGLSAAAVLLLCLMIAKLTHPEPSEETTATATGSQVRDQFATLTYAKDAVWSTGIGVRKPRLNQILTNGPWTLKSGMVTLGFHDGTQATIKGPAVFDVNKNNVIELSEGDLVAVNGDGKNLTVNTGGKRIVSRGKSFGVKSGSDKEAKVCVFQGSVELGSANQPTMMIAAGSYSPAMSFSGIQPMTTNDRSPFQKSLMAAIGINTMKGATLLFPSDIEFGLMEKEADGTAYLIPERHLSKGQRIKVTQIGVGTLEGESVQSAEKSWVTKEECRSYLLHASPSTRVESRGSGSFAGKITFRHPIKAVITSSKLLDATEKKLADYPRTESDPGRGLEPFHAWEESARGQKVSDIIKVGNGGKTLFFSLKVGHGLDQIRIITAAR